MDCMMREDGTRRRWCRIGHGVVVFDWTLRPRLWAMLLIGELDLLGLFTVIPFALWHDFASWALVALDGNFYCCP